MGPASLTQSEPLIIARPHSSSVILRFKLCGYQILSTSVMPHQECDHTIQQKPAKKKELQELSNLTSNGTEHSLHALVSTQSAIQYLGIMRVQPVQNGLELRGVLSKEDHGGVQYYKHPVTHENT